MTDVDLTPRSRRIRQSTIGDADICLRRMQYSVAGATPRVESEPAMLGTAYHAGLEMYYRERQDRGPTDPSPEAVGRYVAAAVSDLKEQVRNADRVAWDTSQAEGEILVEGMVRAYFAGKHYWPAPWQVIGVEWQFDAEFLPNWDAHGTVDLIIWHPDQPERLVMVDHKTAGRMWSEKKASARVSNQAPYYAKWIMQAWPDIAGVDVWFDVMRRDGLKFQRFQSLVDQRHIDAVLVKAAAVAHLLDLGVELPPNQSSNLCSSKYCDAWDICPYGAALT